VLRLPERAAVVWREVSAGHRIFRLWPDAAWHYRIGALLGRYSWFLRSAGQVCRSAGRGIENERGSNAIAVLSSANHVALSSAKATRRGGVALLP
jgi:hypothetical protein